MVRSTGLRVVIDTNVFISGLVWGGTPGLVISSWRKGKFTLLMSPLLLSEIVLVLERFRARPHQIEVIRNEIEANSAKLIPTKRISCSRDKMDNKILELCLEGQADYLVTGDKDLLALKTFKGTRILKPRGFLRVF